MEGENIKAKKIIRHKKYNSNSMRNDIAVIELAQSVTFSASVGIVCLPPRKMNYDNKIATISGWGDLEHNGDQPDKLRDAQVKVISNNECKEITGDEYTLTKDMVCGYGNGKQDTCQGDSGGPMVVEVDDHHDLVG